MSTCAEWSADNPCIKERKEWAKEALRRRMQDLFTLKMPLGIGTMFWGDTRLDEWMAGRIISDKTLLKIREMARERGVIFFDTAEGYGVGSSEARLGRVGFTASDNLVATKFLPTLWRWTSGAFVRAMRDSNRRLGTQQCALSFIHSPVHPRSPRVWIRGAARAMREGTLQALGVSNFNAEQVRAAWKVAREEGVPLVANQLMFSLLVYHSAELRETVAACRELGLAVVGYGGLGQGLLTGRLTPERLAKNRLARRMNLSVEALALLREAIGTVAKRHQKSMARNLPSVDSKQGRDSTGRNPHLRAARGHPRRIRFLLGARGYRCTRRSGTRLLDL